MSTALRFTFRHSKTNQFGLMREHVTMALAIPGRLSDPYDAVMRAFALCPHASATDPAFPVSSGQSGQAVPLTHTVFTGYLKQCLREIGVDHSKYSGHSFRRGGATFAHRLGVDPLLIKRMGDWQTDACLHGVCGASHPRGPGPPAPNPRSSLRRLRVIETGCGLGSPGWVG